MMSVILNCNIKIVKKNSLVLISNINGSRKPLFWCFNHPTHEMNAIKIIHHREQPLYGLFSGSEILHKSNDKVAEHYVQEILSIDAVGPYRIGGNCQGGAVAIIIVNRLLEMEKVVERLCLLEYFRPVLYKYTGPMLLLHCEMSKHKNQERFNWKKTGWEEAFIVTPKVEALPCAHGRFYMRENIGLLVNKISTFMRDD